MKPPDDDNRARTQYTNTSDLLQAYQINLPDPQQGQNDGLICPQCSHEKLSIFIEFNSVYWRCNDCNWHGFKQLAREEDPVDLWANFDAPPLPRGLLPETIEQFAFTQGEMMGADPAGLAMSGLVVCAAVIPDHIMIQPKKHDSWTESARIWAALVGLPSTMKTPSANQAKRPLERIDSRMARANADARRQYDNLPNDQRKATPAPPQPRLRLDDTTMEAAQDVLKDSPNGLLCTQDELGGWFGGMDKYSGHRAAMKDRGFWLRTWNGGDYPVSRIGRGNFLIPNLSVCMLGGIQPEAIRLVAGEAVDDGLLQRLFPIMLQPATMGKDEPIANAVLRYEELVAKLHENYPKPVLLHFAEDARPIRQRLEQKHLELVQCEVINKKLGAHIGKYNGLFARLCVLWHCIEQVGNLNLAYKEQ